MTEENNIPVCTLFNQADDTSSGDGNFFNNQSTIVDNAKQAANDENEAKERSDDPSDKRPVVCNLFESIPSEEDLFSGISNSKPPVIEDHGREMTENHEIEESETGQRDTKDEKNSADHNLHYNELSEIFDTLVADGKNETASDLNADSRNEESKNATFDNSDMMASILINDDSFDNISSISMEQSSKLDSPDTEVTNTSVTIESESCDELEVTSKTSSEVISIKEPSSPERTSTEDTQEKVESKSNVETEPIAVNESIIPYTTSAFYAVKPKEEKNDDQKIKAESSFPPQVVSKSEPQVASSLFGESTLTNPFDAIDETSSSNHIDAFTNALHTSEVDRRRDAWIPSESTRVALAAVLQSQKRIPLEPDYLTRPGIATGETLGDPVKAVMARHKGVESTIQRETLSANSVTCDKTGLHQLVASGNYRSAVDLCGKALTSLGQGSGRTGQESVNSSKTLQWWHTRFSLLLHLKLYDLAVVELEQFRSFDTADLYYEFYPDLYPGRRGSMVPFSLRLLYADFPRHINQPTEALSRLYSVQHICTKIISNLNSGKAEDGSAVLLKDEDKDASLKLWTQRKVKVKHCIGNTLLQLREYHSAVKVFDEIIEDKPEDAVALLSGIGRALLQLGDVKAAQQRFAQAERLAGADSWHKVQLVSNRGFLYLGANNWKEALNQFNEALKTDPTNVEALNNKAVCLLYLCRLREAIAVQEEAVRLRRDAEVVGRPDSSKLNEIPLEGALSNLVTLYELESAKAIQKKQDLLSHVAVNSGDGFNVTCLKM